ncbi:MAG: hypothetical protein F4X98_15840 [Gammaproteobacteria bacterium]|nr:hypothetical protein [Gammaproteobacteria bacterium]
MNNGQRPRPLARPDGRAEPTAHDIEALGDELRALADLEAPAGTYDRIRQRLDTEPVPESRGSRRMTTPIAMAASVAALAVATVFVWRSSEQPDNSLVAQSGWNEEHLAALADLMERSRLAEERRPLIVVDSPTGPERLLRARIGGIDAALNEQLLEDRVELLEREALLRNRVELMNTLADIERYRHHEFVRQVAF